MNKQFNLALALSSMAAGAGSLVFATQLTRVFFEYFVVSVAVLTVLTTVAGIAIAFKSGGDHDDKANDSDEGLSKLTTNTEPSWNLSESGHHRLQSR